MSDDETSAFSLDWYVQEFHDKNADWSTGLHSSDVWLRFVETATYRIAEFVRREEHAKTLEALGKAFGWLCCFVGRYRISQPREKFTLTKTLSEIVWNKYPGLCYYCAYRFKKADLVRKGYLSCMCLGAAVRTDAQKQRALRNCSLARQHKRKPGTVDDWADMIRQVYGGAHRDLSMSAICLHFLEEVGEVAKALRQIQELQVPGPPGELEGQVAGLEEELADVFSWTFGLANKTDQILEKARTYYDEARLPPVSISSLFSEALTAPVTDAVVG